VSKGASAPSFLFVIPVVMLYNNTMIPINTKEELAYFMQTGMMRLSKYDLRFIQNLYMYTVDKMNLTTNQVDLFDKLVQKYSKQLSKHGVNENKIASLHWKSNIVESDPKFTESYIWIVDGIIRLKSPFNTKFVSAFSKVANNTFKWIKEKKFYESPYSTFALKILLEYVHSYYPIVNYCPVTVDLLNKLNDVRAKFYTPTLVKANNHLLIAAVSEYLHSAVENIELSTDPLTISKLAKYGIEIDEDIINSDPCLSFASKYVVEVDFKDLDSVIENLLAINCDAVLVTNQSGMKSHYRKILFDKLKENNITVDSRMGLLVEDRLSAYKQPVCITLTANFYEYRSTKFSKIVIMKNSLPVNVK